MPDSGLVFQVLAALVAAGAVYGGIRSDIRHIHQQLEHLGRAADSAHARIDRISEGRRGDV
ncbi:MAG: hypothetical protein L6Q55_00975 [Azonexus sp.]|nr:hypothetical protein [Azonexus sp.]MCK6410981.1 hypothetical protein [Azonexus sp.]